MKKMIVLLFLVCMACPSSLLYGEDFLGAPVVPGGKTIRSLEGRLEKLYETGYDEIVKRYQESLKDYEHVKFWDRTTQTYIEDHSNRPWHSITIEKDPSGGTKVVMLKDNWTWIIGTLVLRFIAVFVVLLVLYAAMSISGAILSRVGAASEAKK
jgi:hypothetical protein